LNIIAEARKKPVQKIKIDLCGSKKELILKINFFIGNKNEGVFKV